MLPVTMTPIKASKQAAAAASKIKNKMLNTSSFFKVSLKTNNRALALALEAQKERSRQLAKEIVYLQKQVEALCFELATKKYKHRKLLLILKNLQSNTLQHLGMVADLFSDSDLPKLFEENKTLSGDNNEESLVVGSLTDQLPPQPEISEALLCPPSQVTANLPQKKCLANAFNNPKTPQNSTDTCNDDTDAGKRHSSGHIHSPHTGTTRPSSSLRDEVERLSVMFSQSRFDSKSVPCLPCSQTPSVESMCEKPKPCLSDDAHLPSSSVMETEPEHVNKQEKTVLLNTTMEMTQSNVTEIVTVETKAKKPGRSGNPKGKKNKKRVCGSSEAENLQVKNSADSWWSEVHNAPTGTVLQTDDQSLEDIRDPEVIELQSPKTECMSVFTSRIPKLSKSQVDNHQKMAKYKFKSHYRTTSETKSCDKSSPDPNHYFLDADAEFSKTTESVKLLPEKDTADVASSKITCRRSRTKGRRVSSVTRKTFVILPLPLHESESSPSKSKQICNEVEEEHTVSEPQSEVKTATYSGGNHKSRCRGTFVISVASDDTSLNRASPEVGTVERDLMPSTGPSTREAEESSAVMEESVIREHSESNTRRHSDGLFVEETLSSCKRPWLATQDSGSPQDDFSSNNNHEVLHLYQGTEFQKPKKARREEMSIPSKKKAVQRECVDHLNERKKKSKSNHSNKGFISEDEACYLGNHFDGPERNNERLDDLQVVDSHADISDRDDIFKPSNDLKPNESESKSRMEWNPKRCRKTSKLHTPVETRNPRETFVVYRRKTQDNVSLNTTRSSDVSHAHSLTSDEAGHENLGDLLMDELPPWLAIDVSHADTDSGSAPATPKRATSGRAAVIEESTAVTTETPSAGRVLTSLTNTIATPDGENRGRPRRGNGVVSYKEPPLNSKIRRGDKFTDSMFLSSPVYKDSKKKRQKKTATNPKMERSILVD